MVFMMKPSNTFHSYYRCVHLFITYYTSITYSFVYLPGVFLSLMQSDPELISAIYGRGIAYGKKSLQVSVSY